MRRRSPETLTAARSSVRRIARWRRWLYVVVPLFATLIVAEAIATWLYMAGVVHPAPKAMWVLEDTGRSCMRFDAVRGCYLSPIPTRNALISNGGQVQSVGVVRGNNEGFPDRSDFQPSRARRDLRRVAVFGDSMSAAPFLSRNWPDTVEDWARDDDQPLELLNFSIHGGGLDNWWSIIKRHVEPRAYQLDAVVFAVCSDDLHRGFTFWDDSLRIRDDANGNELGTYGRLYERVPAVFPTSLNSGAPHFRRVDWRIVSPGDFDRIIQGRLQLKAKRPFKLFLTSRCVGTISRWLGHDLTPAPKFPKLSRQALPMVDDIRVYLRREHLPCFVVHVPMRHELLHDQVNTNQTREFAGALGARLIDGSAAFSGYTHEEIHQAWLPADGHWSQAGSDQFAKFMYRVLRKEILQTALAEQ